MEAHVGLADLAKRLAGGKTVLSAEEFRGAKPAKNPNVEEETTEDGGILLHAPLVLQGKGVMGWIAKRMEAPSTKTFELEPVGAFVWALCDGKHTFEAISRKLRERFKMNRVEADAALTEFLRMLGQRRLITLSMEKRK